MIRERNNTGKVESLQYSPPVSALFLFSLELPLYFFQTNPEERERERERPGWQSPPCRRFVKYSTTLSLLSFSFSLSSVQITQGGRRGAVVAAEAGRCLSSAQKVVVREFERVSTDSSSSFSIVSCQLLLLLLP